MGLKINDTFTQDGRVIQVQEFSKHKACNKCVYGQTGPCNCPSHLNCVDTKPEQIYIDITESYSFTVVKS